MNSFSKFLKFSLSQLSEKLLTESNMEIVEQVGDELPDVFAHHLFGYEKNLLDISGKLDIAVSSTNKTVSKHKFSDVFSYESIKNRTNSSPEWSRLQELAQEWNERKSDFAKKLENISLEFDFESLVAGEMIPSVFLGIETRLFNPSIKRLLQRLVCFNSGIKILSGDNIYDSSRIFLKKMIRSISTEHYIFQVGFMFSREKTPLRVCIKEFKIDTLISNLKIILIDSNIINEAERILNLFGNYFDHFVISLDILNGKVTKTGIECYFKTKVLPANNSKIISLFQSLTENGLCADSLIEPIVNFPRKINLKDKPYFNDIEDRPAFYGQAIHHLKFTLLPNEQSYAKIYLWAGFGY